MQVTNRLYERDLRLAQMFLTIIYLFREEDILSDILETYGRAIIFLTRHLDILRYDSFI